MSDFDRRQFLHMLGIGGMSALATPTGFGIPLFGGDKGPDGLWTPRDRADLLSGHIVAYRPPRIIKPDDAGREVWVSPAVGHENWGNEATVVARITKQLRNHTDCILSSRFTITRSTRMPDTVAEAHAEFFLLSREIRAAFAAYTTEFLRLARTTHEGSLEEYGGLPLSLVTVVDAPIEVDRSGLVYAEGMLDSLSPTVHAEVPAPQTKDTPGIADPLTAGVYGSMRKNGPWSTASDVIDVREKIGDRITAQCHYEQHVVLGMVKDDLPKYDLTTYSEQGEFPIEVPLDVDIGALMAADRKIIADPKAARNRGFIHSCFKRLLS